MNPVIPAADFIQVPWPWFQALLLLVFPLHLLFMNAMVGSAGVALFAHLKGDAVSRRLAHQLAKILPVLVAFAVNLGIAALLFLQVLYGHFFYTSSVLMGIIWLSVIVLVMTAYFALYLYDFRFLRMGRKGLWVVGLAFLIFLVVPFIFTNNMTLMLRPEAWSGYFKNPAGTILNLDDPTLWPRYLHMLIGSLAIGALFVAVFGKFQQKRDPEMAAYATSLGLGVFSYLTLAQMLEGLVFLVFLPQEVKLMFLGGHPLATTVFLTAFLLALLVLISGFRRQVVLTAALALPLLYLMSFIRAYVRAGYLRPHFTLDRLELIPQYSPMILFFAVLLAGAGVLAWLLRNAYRVYAQGQGAYDQEESRQ